MLPFITSSSGISSTSRPSILCTESYRNLQRPSTYGRLWSRHILCQMRNMIDPALEVKSLVHNDTLLFSLPYYIDTTKIRHFFAFWPLVTLNCLWIKHRTFLAISRILANSKRDKLPTSHSRLPQFLYPSSGGSITNGREGALYDVVPSTTKVLLSLMEMDGYSAVSYQSWASLASCMFKRLVSLMQTKSSCGTSIRAGVQ